MTTNKKFRIVLLKEGQDMIVVSVSCSPRLPKGPRIRYEIGEIVDAIREEYPQIGEYLFGATLINYYPDKIEAQFGFKPKKRVLLLEQDDKKSFKKAKKPLHEEIVRPFDDLPKQDPEKIDV